MILIDLLTFPYTIAKYVLWIFLILNNDVKSCANFLFFAIIRTPEVSLSSLWTIKGLEFSKYFVFLRISIIFFSDLVPDWTGSPVG